MNSGLAGDNRFRISFVAFAMLLKQLPSRAHIIEAAEARPAYVENRLVAHHLDGVATTVD
jgi:hypothetical protein